MEKNKIKVIVVDDDLLFGNMVLNGLIAMGYDVLHFSSLIGINNTIEEFNPSILLLDVEIGDKNGISESLSIRNRYSQLPIIFISARPFDKYIQEALITTGAVFLKKPCSIIEISSYIDKFAIVNNNNSNSNSNSIAIGTCELFTDTKTLRDNLTGDIHNLKTREFEVLLLLVKNKNKITENEQISQHINITDNQVIYNTITSIRKYLTNNDFATIISYKKRGYMLKLR
ncbi:MAG: response regulator [Rikenellaceae bacterium]